MKRRAILYLLVWVLLAAAGCSGVVLPPAPEDARKVFILYADGYNNLVGYMKSDIADLSANAPSRLLSDRYKFVVYAHFTAKSGDYHTPNSPVLMDIYKDGEGNVVRDTLRVYPDTTNTSAPWTLETVLKDVKELFPAREYGLVYSSHGTGWLPEEYYSTAVTGGSVFSPFAVPAPPDASSHPFTCENPLVKSVGCTAYYRNGDLHTHEMELPDLSAALMASGIHFSYVIFDACLMGCVETAYQLRSAADYVVSSAEEIYVEGLNYKKMLDRVLYSRAPLAENLSAVCSDYVTGSSSATISLFDCSKAEALAAECNYLFDRYASAIATMPEDSLKVLQGYFRTMAEGPRHWFYDLRDIVRKSGVDKAGMDRLDAALDAAVIYKQATENGISGAFKIRTFCGLSMYLPLKGSAELDAWYRELDWNKSTSLVK